MSPVVDCSSLARKKRVILTFIGMPRFRGPPAAPLLRQAQRGSQPAFEITVGFDEPASVFAGAGEMIAVEHCFAIDARCAQHPFDRRVLAVACEEKGDSVAFMF